MTPQSFLASLLLLRPSTLAFLAILLLLLALPRLLWAGLCCFRDLFGFGGGGTGAGITSSCLNVGAGGW